MNPALMRATWKLVSSPTGIRFGMQLSAHWGMKVTFFRIP